MIISPDQVNGMFEALGGFMILKHCLAVLKDKAVAGVSFLATGFFTLWGFWNLFYYPNLGQFWSLAGGVLIVAANCLWIALLLKYRKTAKLAVTA